MTIDNALEALRIYVDSKSETLAGLEIHITGDDTVYDPPFISITETGSEEHDVLPGVITLSIDVRLASVSGETVDDATPDTTHRALAAELSVILSDYEAAKQSCDTYPYFTCFGIRKLAPRTIREDGRRVTNFPLVMVCE